jgi:hypothetical protein
MLRVCKVPRCSQTGSFMQKNWFAYLKPDSIRTRRHFIGLQPGPNSLFVTCGVKSSRHRWLCVPGHE